MFAIRSQQLSGMMRDAQQVSIKPRCGRLHSCHWVWTAKKKAHEWRVPQARL
jgi:hypothetical protein